MATKRQFSVKHLLALTFLVAVCILIWQRFIYVHPAHNFPPYEKARYSRNGRIKMGPCKISVASVARNDRDRSLLVEDGFRRTLEQTVGNDAVLRKCGPWLDAGQIELDVKGGEADIIEIRVFDHETRQILSTIDSTTGSQLVDGNSLQLYRIGGKLPDSIDLFLRLNTYAAESKPVIAAPKEGEVFDTKSGPVQIHRIIRGMTGYALETGFRTSPKEESSKTAILLRAKDHRRKGWYKSVAVLKNGQRVHRNMATRFPGDYLLEDDRRAALIDFNVGLDRIKHIELRPIPNLDMETTFFFDGLQLPKTSPAKFQKPPSPTIPVNGAEMVSQVTVAELQPLDVTLRVMAGKVVNGVNSGSYGTTNFRFVPTPEAIDSESSVLIRLGGVQTANWKIATTPNSTSVSGTGASGSSQLIEATTFSIPIDQLQSVQIQMP